MLKLLALSLGLLPSATLAQSLWQAQGARVETVAYTCSTAMDDLSVAYFTAPDATSFAAVQIAGVVHAMVQEVSGSGVRFVDTDAQSGYRLHSKGDQVLLLKQEPGGATEEQLLAECRARKD
ncbi:MliC family protein [Tabrizicola oligotrophica]|uniref:Lysozyme inhibitor n=1 Tax=Tabrizicola oligotrophica TaxID=2710650 RepID=A0A6M0QS26_9RHOB|nr:MliC family protein [Tabrizicola oligotrophica]NEY89242.1 lysozyme inhibitor [Tabrizicola oligotrophica]